MLFRFLTVLCLCVAVAPAYADNHHDHGKGGVKVVTVTDGITMFQAGGGNVGVFAGEDGVFVIDSDLKGSGWKLLSAIGDISDKPVKFLVNTHWHYDHTGSNAHFHDEGGAVILAHDNVRKRMAAGQYIAAFDNNVLPAKSGALPVLTYDSGMRVHMNGESVRVIAVPAAHTDGDSVVYWPESNVIHTGDLFFNGFWPFIDASSGGRIDGVIAAVEQVLVLADEDTKIIPGHGPLAGKADLVAYRDVLKVVSERAHAAKAAGKSAQEWVAEKPLAAFESEWADGFLSTDQFITIVWAGL